MNLPKWKKVDMLEKNFLIDITEANLAEILQMTQDVPVVFNFTSLNDPECIEFSKVLEKIAVEDQGQFILANVDCEKQQRVAAQFRIQSVPTVYLFKDGAPLDAFYGSLSEPELRAKLVNILPREEELKYQEALVHLEHEDFAQALPLLKDAWELTNKKNSDIGLLYAETYIAMRLTDRASEILKQIPIQDRDGRWEGLTAQIELLIKAADTPEIKQLQEDFARNPSNKIALDLALQLHQASRNEESLELLYAILKQDINAEDGAVKQEFLAIISAIGSADPISNKYRRLLYSLLY